MYDQQKQHTHCMSSDNEYVTLIQYTIHLHIDLTTFLTLWAVLSILLDTQDGKCKYVMTIYPPWSTGTDDLNDIDQMTNFKGMKDIRDEICKDTPQKTEINKPYIDNIDSYNRDRQLITASLSNRLDLGQNSLPGAQQVRVAVKHTDQTSEFPEHLR